VTHLTVLCTLVGCQVVENLGDRLSEVFLVAPTLLGGLDWLLQILPLQLGIVSVEVDQLVNLLATPPLTSIPNQLVDNLPVDYHGTVVSHGYLEQPASSIVRISETQNRFDVSGSDIVAVIDTGVDPAHPALAQFCCLDTISSTTPTAQTKPVTLITQRLPSWTEAAAILSM
jgi:hypothetical protein